jgi:regulatory protein SWI5
MHNLHPTPRQNAHRRGQSLDQSRSPIRRQTNQAGSMVSITNIGSTQQGQQILREAQQQKLARPGQRNETSTTPQCGLFPLNTQFNLDAMYNTNNTTTMNAMMQDSGDMQIAHSPFYAQDMNMPMSAGFDSIGLGLDENSQHYFQPLHHPRQDFGNGMMDARRMSQPDLQLYAEHRPITPTQRINTGKYEMTETNLWILTAIGRWPLTPSTTPFKQTIPHLEYSRSAQSSPMKRHADQTIKAPCPISMQRGRSLEGIFETREFDHEAMSPPVTAPLMPSSTFDMADMPVPQSSSQEAPSMTFTYSNASHLSSHASPVPQSPPQTRYHASPHVEQLPFFDETGGEVPSMVKQPVPVLQSSNPEATVPKSPVRAALSPRRMSISDLNLEPGISASIQETNITLDDIAQYIEGPDPADNKWVCKFDDCNKRFGRKENIKSHVQTHLDDRQFQCDHCNKRFVRGHDLKRHAKIHTGTKPYPCLCGNAFARQDALTRHRQRGMCIGAIDGVTRKFVKRGRPRKHRPEMDERVDKASRTRKRANERENPYESSASSCSFSSWDSPPTENLENLSIRGGSPFDDMALFGGSNPHVSIETIGLPPDMFTFTPPASPGYSTGNKPSPQHRSLTPTDLADIPELPSHPTPIPDNMIVKQSRHTPPSLSYSSSSPAAELVAFDFSEDSTTVVQRMALKMDHDRNTIAGADFDNFLDYSNLGLDTGADSFFDGL